jgi:transposase
VIFSDESKFNVSNSDGRVRVYRNKGERFLDKCVQKRNKWGGGGVHVWAGITRFNKTELVVLERNVSGRSYVEDVLQPVLLPFVRRLFPQRRCIFQQDNAPAHTSRRATEFLRQNNIDVLDWPSLSPDMSPIEHVWDELSRRIRLRHPQPRNVNELRQALLDEWTNIPLERISTIVLSMRRRCRACMDAEGSYTRY